MRPKKNVKNLRFKQLFTEVASSCGFQAAFGGWFRASDECIVVLELTKSNHGNYYQLNIKIYFQGAFNKTYSKSKDLVKKEIGNISRGEPREYSTYFALDQIIDDDARKAGLDGLFNNFLVPFTNRALTKKGLKELAQKDEIYLTPAVNEELMRLLK